MAALTKLNNITAGKAYRILQSYHEAVVSSKGNFILKKNNL